MEREACAEASGEDRIVQREPIVAESHGVGAKWNPLEIWRYYKKARTRGREQDGSIDIMY